MLPIKINILTVQIITTITLIITILLCSCCSTTESLPITSKPIESTAENLAWEAWLMVPVGQQQKTRKVTPKSIFIVPKKKNQTSTIQCQPGEHLFESRCIPTVNIDTEKILLTQLTNLVITSGDYDYDYDEEGLETLAPARLEGDSDLIPRPVGDNSDEPLKFDIFRDNFPIGSSGSGDSSGNREPEDESVFYIGERRRRPPIHETTIPDLDTGSTNHGTYHENEDDGDKEDDSSLFLSGIDAILVPAAVAVNKDQHLNFSIYQDGANASKVDSDVEILKPIAEQNVDIHQILEDESMFLDKEETVTTTEKIETTTNEFEEETTTMKLEADEDVESKTEFTRSVTEVPEEEETTNSSTQPTDSTEISSTMVGEENITTTLNPVEEDTTLKPDSDDQIAEISSSKEDITMISSPDEDITTIRSQKEDITTMSSSKEDITTISSLNDDITTFSNSDIEPQSNGNSETNSNLENRSALADKSKDRFLYHRLSDDKTLPPVIDINAELKMINDLVANKLPPSTTTATPSSEPTSTSWPKIIPLSNAITSTSSMPVQSSISSLIESSTSSSSSSTRSSSSSSSITNSIPSSTDRQESVIDTSSSTSPPSIAESNPFWWLPTGWRVDRTDADRPLLLRFWSALSGISGSQTKV